MKTNKKAFSFVEILVVLAILVILWFAITKVSMDSKEKRDNAKINSDLISINNGLNLYFQENQKLPLPDWTINYFDENWKYIHDSFDDSELTFWAYWVSPDLWKKYFSEELKDPRTNNFYSYWLSKNWELQVAWVLKDKEQYQAKISWDFKLNEKLSGLIREYNWLNFVTDLWRNLPYNPELVLLSATDLNWNTFVKNDVLEIKSREVFKNWEKLVTEFTQDKKVSGAEYYDLYFSDWSIARFEIDEDLKVTFWKDNEIFDFIKWSNKKSKIALFFETGSMWIFSGSKEKSGSELEVSFRDTTAAVRWTIFHISSKQEKFLTVYKGWVELRERWGGDCLVSKDSNSCDKWEYNTNFENVPDSFVESDSEEISNSEKKEFDYQKIFEGYIKKETVKGKKEIVLKTPSKYILEFEMSWEEVNKFLNWNKIFTNSVEEKEKEEGKEENKTCKNNICDLLKVDKKKIYIHHNSETNACNVSFEEEGKVKECSLIPFYDIDFDINLEKNYKLIYKVNTEWETEVKTRIYNFYIIDQEKQELISELKSINLKKYSAKWLEPESESETIEIWNFDFISANLYH